MIFFYIKEALKSIKRAKASFILTSISLTLAVLLILSSIAAIQLSLLYENRLKHNVRINIFLQENVKSDEIEEIKKKLEKENFVSSVKYISKEQAAVQFVKETGEDFREILDYNPLPASFIVMLQSEVLNTDTLGNVASYFSEYEWADDVVFKDSFVYRIINIIDSFKQYIFILTGLIFLISLYLVFSTIKLIINSRVRELETMKLVGAKLSAIKIPILFNGILAGVISGIVATLLFYFIIFQLLSFQSLINFIQSNRIFYLIILLATGPILSLLVTFGALRKVTLKI